MSRDRPAPSACRTAISLRRLAPRARSNPDTFAHAVSSTEADGCGQQRGGVRVIGAFLQPDPARGSDVDATTLVDVGIGRGELPCQDLHLRLSVGHRAPIVEPPDEIDDVTGTLERVAVSVARPEHRARNPDVGLQHAAHRAVEPDGHHADDLERHAVQPDARAEDVRVSCKTRLPQIVADDGDREFVRNLVLFGKKEPAGDRTQPEKREVVPRHHAPVQQDRLTLLCRVGDVVQVNRGGRIMRGEIRENARVVAQGDVVRYESVKPS